MTETRAHAHDDTVQPVYRVNEAMRRKFESAWVQGRPTPIEECLPTAEDASYLPTLIELVHIELEFSWKAWSKQLHQAHTLTTGDTESRPPGVESYLERFPALKRRDIALGLLQQEYDLRRQLGDGPSVEEYQHRFPDLKLSADTLASGASHDTLTYAAGDSASADFIEHAQIALQQLGDYELLEELGRGGMGVVFRALQRSTDRIVALKVIRLDRLSALPPDSQSSLLERFRHEVQAAARLNHENIVTVYEVGEVEGHQYYAMRYVDGRSLAEVLQAGPLPLRKAAQYVEGIARAVHEAHETGILHRDLKPHNVLVDTKNDRALVTDFGLAKLLTAGDQLTRAGDVLGTPSYMAPEQARDAAKVTQAADIYGLGATLYHLLTGRPPFQAAQAVETLRQVMDEEPVAPSQLNPDVNRDLETVCLKCLQKEPDRRYATADAVADDLACYLIGTPIQARPIGKLERTFRWCHRNPITAGAIGAAVACLMLAFGAALTGFATTRTALEDAEDNYRIARATVDRFYTQVSQADLLNVPRMHKVRRDLLLRALDHYQKFLLSGRHDKSLRQEMGLAYYRVASITEEIDSAQAALPSYEQAVQIQEEFSRAHPDDPQAQQALGTTLNAMGRALRKTEALDEAITTLQDAQEIRAQLVERNPDDVEFKRTLANTQMNIGVVEKARQNFDLAEAEMREAQQLRLSLLPAESKNPEIRRDLGKGFYNLGALALAKSDLKTAEKDLGTAVTHFKAARQLAPGDIATAGRLATCCRVLGQVHVHKANVLAAQGFKEESQQARDAAILQYQMALENARMLAQMNPDVVAYQRDLGAISNDMAFLYLQQGDTNLAARAYESARSKLEPLIEKESDLRRDLAVTLRQLASIRLTQGRDQEAVDLLQEARGHLEFLTDAHPDNELYRAELKATVDAIKAKNGGTGAAR